MEVDIFLCLSEEWKDSVDVTGVSCGSVVWVEELV
jgi:hypothetical protein